MSQKIQIKSDGRAYPVIACDHCGFLITYARHGNTVWREDAATRSFGGEQEVPIYHTHKRCNAAFERSFGTEGDAKGGWMWCSHDLPHDLFMLLLNVEYDVTTAERKARSLAMFQ
jgi:hypothetical protein